MLYCMIEDMMNIGKYYCNSHEAKTSDESRDMGLADWLWSESQRLTGIGLV